MGIGRGVETGARQPDPYTRQDRIRAINLAALAGWTYFAARYLIDFRNPGGLPYFALWGIPVALAFTWVFAGPILFWLVRGPVSWIATACWGAAISGLMTAGGFGLKSFQRWHASVNPNFHYQIGGGDHVQIVDGVLTPYGWRVELASTIEFFLLGVAAALFVRAVIGKGAEGNTI